MIEPVYFWPAIVLLAVGTFLIRSSLIAVSHRVNISPALRELFTYIPAAVFPALVVPAVWYHQGQVSWLMGKERLLVLILATLVSLRFRSMLGTIVFGLGLLYLLTHA